MDPKLVLLLLQMVVWSSQEYLESWRECDDPKAFIQTGNGIWSSKNDEINPFGLATPLTYLIEFIPLESISLSPGLAYQGKDILCLNSL
jgi:hypothetical protein